MMFNKNIIIAAIVFIVLVLGFMGFRAMNANQEESSLAEISTEQESQQEEDTTEATSPGGAMENTEATFILNPEGVSTRSITIKAGEAVTWVNNSGQTVEIASSQHPSHTEYPPLNTVGEIPNGGKKSFTFPTPGVYKWHDHLNTSFNGSVTVE
jgi:plastocyanin